MGTYILSKILRAVFVIFWVIVAVFYLQHVSRQFFEEEPTTVFEGRALNKAAQKKVNEQRYIDKKLNLPLFYFGLYSSSRPFHLNYISDNFQRRLYTKMYRYFRSPKEVLRYTQIREHLRAGVPPLEDNEVKMNNYFNCVTLSCLFEWHSINDQKAIELTTYKPLVEQWNKLALVSTSKWLFPKMTFHGLNNQFHYYFSKLISGNFGVSKTDGQPTFTKILQALKWSFTVNVFSLILSVVLGLIITIWMVNNTDSLRERSSSMFFFFWYTMPVFWIAILFVMFFTTGEYGNWLHIFPTVGIKYWYYDRPFFEQIILNFRQLILPITCLVLPSLAYFTRLMKSKMLEIQSQPFVLTARSKGLTEKEIMRKHVLRNSLIPLITMITGAIPTLFSGSLIIEIVFDIPGMGKLMYDSILNTDWSVISSIVILMSLVTVFAYFLADILYALVNPQIKISMKSSNSVS